jgi:3-dehydroquinate dehydratase-1/3-dehydroquinate dehydratase/shikimate dehydrogenase
MNRGKICVSIAAPSPEAVRLELEAVQELADVVEIRLDAMDNPDVAKCCQLVQKPLLFTFRPGWEGGSFNGFEDDRMGALFAAIDLQAAFVDFELRADPLLRGQLLQAMDKSPTRLILSWHDFKQTPSDTELAALLEQMKESGAHIGKIVTTARETADVLRLFRLQERALADGFPLCCFAMGEAGRISRLATLFLGGYMSYCAVNEEQATAPGQLSVAAMQKLCTIMTNGVCHD